MLRGAGDPLLYFFFDFEIYQDSTIVKFCVLGNSWEKPIVFNPRKIQKINKSITYVFKDVVDLVGIGYALRIWDIHFKIL